MVEDKWSRGAVVFGSCYIKRWLEGHYEQLLDLPALAKLKALGVGSKLGVEAILYTLTAYAEQRMSDQSPLGLMAKTLLMDAAPEIASRLTKDARAGLTMRVSSDSGLDESRRTVAERLLSLENGELLSVLASMEEMDDSELTAFLSFAANASKEELAKFGSLPKEHRIALMAAHAFGPEQKAGRETSTFKAFAKDFWEVFKAGSRKTSDVSLLALNRYLLRLLWVLKTSGVIWAMGILTCSAIVAAGPRPMLWPLFGLIGVGVLGVIAGWRLQKSWLTVAGIVTVVVLVLQALLTVAGYSESVFGVSLLFLVGVPTLAIVALLLPVTTVFEILRKLVPNGQETLIRASQMLLTAFLGILFFVVVLLVFPPQDPVAFLLIVMLVIVLALSAGFGLLRVNPEMFLRVPIVIGVAFSLLITLGIMSMPNLRHQLRTFPGKLDGVWAAPPEPVAFASSKDIEFVTVGGDSILWYAERSEGGYDLFKCEGIGPYFTPDGRPLIRADTGTARNKIIAWVDQVAAKLAEDQREAEQALATRQHAEQERRAEEARKAERERRARYLGTGTIPAEVDFIVCASTALKEPLDNFATELTKQLEGMGKTAANGVFAPAFVLEGGFDLFFEGRGVEDIVNMPLSQNGQRLLLVRCDEVISKPSAIVSGLITSTVNMHFLILDTEDGKILQQFRLSAVAPGTSDTDARNSAFERILDQVSKRDL